MGHFYKPGVWVQRYRRLTQSQRDRVNQLTNQRFAERTGVRRKLDPRRDRKLCSVWLQIRDEVMAEGTATASISGIAGVNRAVTRAGQMAQSAAQMASRAIHTGALELETPWMGIARAEHRKGVKEIPGKSTTPRS